MEASNSLSFRSTNQASSNTEQPTDSELYALGYCAAVTMHYAERRTEYFQDCLQNNLTEKQKSKASDTYTAARHAPYPKKRPSESNTKNEFVQTQGIDSQSTNKDQIYPITQLPEEEQTSAMRQTSKEQCVDFLRQRQLAEKKPDDFIFRQQTATLNDQNGITYTQPNQEEQRSKVTIDKSYHSLNSEEQFQVRLRVVKKRLDDGMPVFFLRKKFAPISGDDIREWVYIFLNFGEEGLKDCPNNHLNRTIAQQHKSSNLNDPNGITDTQPHQEEQSSNVATNTGTDNSRNEEQKSQMHLSIVKQHLNEKVSISYLSKEYNCSKCSICRWINDYKLLGEDGLKSSQNNHLHLTIDQKNILWSLIMKFTPHQIFNQSAAHQILDQREFTRWKPFDLTILDQREFTPWNLLNLAILINKLGVSCTYSQAIELCKNKNPNTPNLNSCMKEKNETIYRNMYELYEIELMQNLVKNRAAFCKKYGINETTFKRYHDQFKNKNTSS